MKKESLLIIFLFFFVFFVSAEDLQINVLVIHSSSVEMPWVTSFNNGIEEIRKANFPRIHFFFEFMGKDFTGNSLDNDDWVFYLNSKYSTQKLDFIIAESAEAVLLLTDNPELFPAKPKIMRSVFQPENPGDMLLYISSDIKSAVGKTFSLAMKQNPETRSIVIINGGTLQSENVVAYFNNVLLEDFPGSIRIISDFAVEEMLDEISLLDRNSLVFYTAVLKDKNGAGLVPRDVLDSVCRGASAPVYTFWNSLMGTGVVGGAMLDAETISKEMVRAGKDYLQNGEFGDYYETLHTYLDWNALRKYKLRATDDSATILNKPVSPFILYYKEIITVALLFFVLLSVAIFVVLRKFKKLNSRLEAGRTELQVLVEEKSILIREIDHRVKNNLSILRELVELQMMNSGNPEIINDLREVSGRIGVMVLVHEKLFKAETENLLDTRKFFEDLVHQIIKAMLTDSVLINIETDIHSVPIDTKTAITCGLIINELLTNAFKYAFPHDKKGGVISVIIRPVSDSFYEIIVKDNGRGLPSDFNPDTGSGLGLKVVQRLTSQIHGELQTNSNEGTEFKLLMEIKNH